MKRRGFLKLVGAIGAAAVVPVKEAPAESVPILEFERVPEAEVYGQGPGFAALRDQHIQNDFARKFAKAAAKQMDEAILGAFNAR